MPLVRDDLLRIARHNHLNFRFHMGLPEVILKNYLLAIGVALRKKPFHFMQLVNLEKQFLTTALNVVDFCKNYLCNWLNIKNAVMRTRIRKFPKVVVI